MLCFKIGGVPVTVSFWFVAIISVYLATDSSYFSVISILCCVLHELGHIIAFIWAKTPPLKLSLELTGMRIVAPSEKLDVLKEIVVQSAGIITNILLAIPTMQSSNELWQFFAMANLVIAGFNLLPLKSLDGGKLVALVMQLLKADIYFIDRCTYTLDNAVSIIIFCISLIWFMQTYSITLLILAIGMCISIHINQSHHW